MNYQNFINLILLMRPSTFKNHGLSKNLIVNLTSYPNRFGCLYVSILSLLNQSMSPDKVILWLWEEDFKKLPENIKLLKRNKLEIRLYPKNLKQYLKLIPALEEFPDSYIVVADDDVAYKPTWLEELVESYKKIGGIIAHRGHLLQFNESGSIQPYNDWVAQSPLDNYCLLNNPIIFPTGVGGILYPPNSFNERIFDMELATSLCPTADDIWYYFNHLESNKFASLIGRRDFLNLNNPNESSLWELNKINNDIQIDNMIKRFGMPKSLENVINNSIKHLKDNKRIKLISGHVLQTENDHIGQHILKTKKFYEEDLISYIKRNFHPKYVIDVGSNIGNHAIGFSGIDGYKVFCYEPDPDIAEILKINLELNKIDGEIFTYGLGSHQRYENFYKATSDNLGSGSFLSNNNYKETNKLLIKTLDESFDLNQSVDLLKIDTEGFEYEVLSGSMKIISKYHPIIIIEHQNIDSFRECYKLIKPLDYTPISLHCSTPTFVYKFGYNNITNQSKDHNWVEGFFNNN